MGVEGRSAALAGGVAVLERAIAYLLGGLAVVTPAALGRPTPCEHWDLYDLLDHLDDSLSALHEAVDVGTVTLAAAPAAPGEAIILQVRERATRLLGGWANTGGAPGVRVGAEPMTAALVAGAGAIEVAVHGWDVARSCGPARPIPANLADELLDLSVLLVRGADRPGRFGRPIAVPPHAPAGDRLVAFLGRHPY